MEPNIQFQGSKTTFRISKWPRTLFSTGGTKAKILKNFTFDIFGENNQNKPRKYIIEATLFQKLQMKIL